MFSKDIIDLIDKAMFFNLKYVGGLKANNEQAVLGWTSNKTIHYNNGALFVIELKLFVRKLLLFVYMFIKFPWAGQSCNGKSINRSTVDSKSSESLLEI